MMRLLISSNTKDMKHPRFQRMSLLIVLKWAAVYGYKDLFEFVFERVFGFALDIKPTDLVKREIFFGWANDLQDISFLTLYTQDPEIYTRLYSIIMSKSERFHLEDGRISQIVLNSRAERGHVDMVRYTLGHFPPYRLVNGLEGSRDGVKPLLMAVKAGNLDGVKLLLDYGADPNNCPATDTPLMRAARVSRISVVEILLKAGAKVNEGYPPPIVFAVFREDMYMFRLLRQYGAILNTPETGNWAMAVAELYGLESMVNVLVQEGVEKGAILRSCAGLEESSMRRYSLLHRGHTEPEKEPRYCGDDETRELVNGMLKTHGRSCMKPSAPELSWHTVGWRQISYIPSIYSYLPTLS
ncbi:ankyrin repeat-containing domain protein [Annulohypoxylon moriforme]|nr:ankyrin repeat-containing domain protein [Annulohypoxylon moriforme]